MALKGTLKDFGIAEILQLIGQQAKSGVLHLEGRDEVIHIAMADGNVVRAESAGRKARERLGNMLVRAEVITAEQLERALELQKKSLRRLGDLLVEQGLVSKEDLREMTALQTTETVYRLFHWKSGTYEFDPGDVEWDRDTVTPLRAESLLMEGFRQVDEWPLIRRRIGSSAVTFERLRPLEGAAAGPAREAARDELGGAFEVTGVSQSRRLARGEAAPLEASERRVFALAEPGRPVERIVDLSRLGEFETCKSLLTLVNAGYLKAIAPSGAAAVSAYAHDWQARLRRVAARAVATLAIAAALAGIGVWVDRRGLSAAAAGAVGDNEAQRFLARYQLGRLRGALEVYRVERGDYPEGLDALVDAGLATPRDLRYPWSAPWHYRREDGGRFVLLPPIE